MNQGKLIECPSCKTLVQFKRMDTNLKTCSCGAVVSQSTLQSKIKLDSIKDPVSVIQVGTKGTWKEHEFTVLGRVQFFYEEGVFNYWTLECSDGTSKLLGEAYGIYSFLTAKNIDFQSNESLHNLKIDSGYVLWGEGPVLSLEQKNSLFSIKVEGEAFCIDSFKALLDCSFATESGTHYTIFEGDGFQKYPYLAEYMDFDELRFENLRPFKNSSFSFGCSNCNNQIELPLYPYTQSTICNKCHHPYSAKANFRFAEQKILKNEIEPYIPIGSSFNHKGISYTVVGYLSKAERSSGYKWNEFTLFHPNYGFAYLNEYNGQFTFAKEQGNHPVLIYEEFDFFKYEDAEFELYNSYESRVDSGSGVFAYNAFNNNSFFSKEYIAPPYMWIKDKDSREGVFWFKAEYYSRKQVSKALNNANIKLPSGSIEIHPLKPVFKYTFLELIITTLMAVVLVLIAHLALDKGKLNKELFNQSFYFKDSSNTFSTTLDTVELTRSISNIKFDVSAPVDNTWTSVSVILTDIISGKEYSMEQGVEYYSGYDGGESWSEGSKSESGFLTGIPSGKYIVSVEGVRESFKIIPVERLSVKATYDVAGSKNLIHTLIFIVIVSIVLGVIRFQVEKSRWTNSPFYDSKFPTNE